MYKLEFNKCIFFISETRSHLLHLGNVQKMVTARRDSQRSEMRGQEERCLTKMKDVLPKMKDALPEMEDGPSSSRRKMPKTNL
jgi:hypothetical protein